MCHQFENSPFLPPARLVCDEVAGNPSIVKIEGGGEGSKTWNLVLLRCASPQRKILWHKEGEETETASFASSKASISLSFAVLVMFMEKYSEGKIIKFSCNNTEPSWVLHFTLTIPPGQFCNGVWRQYGVWQPNPELPSFWRGRSSKMATTASCGICCSRCICPLPLGKAPGPAMGLLWSSPVILPMQIRAAWCKGGAATGAMGCTSPIVLVPTRGCHPTPPPQHLWQNTDVPSHQRNRQRGIVLSVHCQKAFLSTFVAVAPRRERFLLEVKKDVDFYAQHCFVLWNKFTFFLSLMN